MSNRKFGGSRGSSNHGGSSRGGYNRRPAHRMRYMRVDPRMLVKKAEPQEALKFESVNQFSDFAISEVLKKNIAQKGYSTPTPIQDKAIPEILQGKDVIGLASTGTGKTAAFMIPLLDKVIKNPDQKVLIIAPTRELAVQIMDEGKSYSQGIRAFFTLVIGGVNIRRQISDLRRRPQFVVGTPGRLKDLAERRALFLNDYNTIVLDEVDRMLDMGFIHDIRSLVAQLPRERHSLFFSATMTDQARSVASEFLYHPVTIEIASSRASDNVNQDIVNVRGRNKIDVLHDILIRPEVQKALVFGRTKFGMEKLSKILIDRGFQATAIHGNKSQSQRQRALNAFKYNDVKVLLATDVASRGIDVDNITHVINYELPETYDDYIHRIGRTGRVDHIGTALTFID